MKKLNLHPTKVWGFIYPLYANLIVFSNDYKSFATQLQKDFSLTSEQWECIRNEWELIHNYIIID